MPTTDERDPVTILFLASSPKGLSPLSLGREMQSIERRIRSAKYGHQLRLTQEWAVQAKDLSECLLRHRPAIVHFSGHGSPEGELVLEDGSGHPSVVNGPALADLFGALSWKIRAVILNACFSKTQAEALSNHVDCVVGIDGSIADESSIAFSEAFYLALAFGCTLRESFNLGRAQIPLAIEGGRDGKRPEFIVRDGHTTDQLNITGDGPGPSGATPTPRGRRLTDEELLRSVRVRRWIRAAELPMSLAHELSDILSQLVDVQRAVTEAECLLVSAGLDDKPLPLAFVTLSSGAYLAWETAISEAARVGPRALLAVLLRARARTGNQVESVERAIATICNLEQ